MPVAITPLTPQLIMNDNKLKPYFTLYTYVLYYYYYYLSALRRTYVSLFCPVLHLLEKEIKRSIAFF